MKYDAQAQNGKKHRRREGGFLESLCYAVRSLQAQTSFFLAETNGARQLSLNFCVVEKHAGTRADQAVYKIDGRF